MAEPKPEAPPSPASDRPKILRRTPPEGLTGSVPALVPARMINEALYCERLMYLEWAQGEFADNHFTVDGRYAHRRTDAASGELPPIPAAAATESVTDGRESSAGKTAVEGRPYEARSVWLSSERLGITAKIDVVEGDGAGSVVPIEYKRGKVPDLSEGAYLPERAQICAQVLLLRDHGYRCDEGAIYYAGSRRRVPVLIDDALIGVTQYTVRRARQLVVAGEMPPPLVDSPKCRGCSLAGICLPDEVNLLKRLRGEPVIEEPEEPDALDGPLDPDPWGLAVLGISHFSWQPGWLRR